MHDVMEHSSLPTLLGADFNLLRDASEKSNGVVNANWSFLFNDCINKWELIDFKLANKS